MCLNPSRTYCLMKSKKTKFSLVCLRMATGFVDIDKHGHTLPYINISSPFERTLKFLISLPFIKPEFVCPKKCETSNPITIITILNQHSLNKKDTQPLFSLYKTQGEIDFFVFTFDNYYGGLIGLNILYKFTSTIDLNNKILIISNSEIPLHLKPNFRKTSDSSVFESCCKNSHRHSAWRLLPSKKVYPIKPIYL